ncbi:Bypass of stop codon 6-like protein [Cladobotryum mycophilum]|uniref:Bypass of stop codon 6-like protein n=1 Tax=Cladobotryum mycophilum TaxID=491253 RepID=A0ABR0SI63_9HYPO
MSSTLTTTVELQQFNIPSHPAPTKQPASGETERRGSNERSIGAQASLGDGNGLLGELGGFEPCLTPAVYAAERWNEPRRNVYRISASFWCFLVMGANDAAYGALIPYMKQYYDLTFVVISLVFLSPFIGYVSSAILNNWLHHKFGQRGVAIISGLSHITAYAVIASHPPYIVLVIAFVLAGFGNGVADAAWNAWVGNLAQSSEVLGLLHSLYGMGGVISPLIATSMITKANLPWYSFYYIMIGLAGIELVALSSAFWDSNGVAYRQIYKENEFESQAKLTEALFRQPYARVCWVAAFFLLCYVGVEVALGGWIVQFMQTVRHSEKFASGMSAVGFWLGITVGRAVLGFVTPRVGIKLSTAIYIGIVMVLELIFWLVPQFYVSVVAVAFQGFFLGPLFPNAVLLASKLLPRQYHVVVIGFAAAFGGCGAALLPFLTGLLSQSFGVKVLQPIILALLVVMLVIWLAFPRLEKKED